MLRHRLVRQSALNINSSSESNSMPSPKPTRRRRSSQESTMYKQLSTESLDGLLHSSENVNDVPKRNGRRHSIACGVLYVDVQKPSLKAAFNSAVRRMSGACSLLSSAPSSTYNLSSHQHSEPPKKKEEEVILPAVLRTYHQNQRLVTQNASNNKHKARNHFQVNRRFSTDCPPPSYSEATNLSKHPSTKSKLLNRQNEVVVSRGSLVTVEDDVAFNQHE